MGKNKIQLSHLFLFFLALSPVTAHCKFFLSDNAQVECSDTGKNVYICNYRINGAEQVPDVRATYGGKEIKIDTGESYPWTGAKTAVLFLVDTSDPARETVIQNNRKHILKILESANTYHRFGLARFDKGFNLIVPVGESKEKIAPELDNLHAVGKITELYRSVLSAISVLEKTDADRKAIYLFSDGLAEDKAYYHDDVVKAANEAGVVIISLGYPRSVSQSVGLQTIRRLSEETGGIYIESANNFDIPDSFLNKPFENLDNGKKFTIDFNPLLESGVTIQGPVDLQLSTTGRNYTVKLNLELTVPEERVEVQTAATGKEVQTVSETPQKAKPEIRVITREVQPEPINKWFWYGVPAALILLLIITIAVLSLTLFRQRVKSASVTGSRQSDIKPYAYLVLQDESKKRYPITRTTWRIGRGRDNELVLNDSSVSRRHAEIHRSKGDIFTVYDLDSMNGVYVNNNKVSKSLVHEGDIIEIGDINLRFTLLSTEYSVEESTIMQNTRAPLTH